MYFTWTPSTGSPTLTFSGTAPDYRLLKAYDGLESMASIIMTAKSLYLDGEFIMAAPWLDNRAVTIPLMIISTDGTLPTLQAEVLALVSTLNPKYGPGVLTFYNDSGAAYALNCVNDSSSPVMDTKTKYTNEWQCTLKFKAYDPTFYNPVASINPFQTFYNGWSFPWSYPMSYGYGEHDAWLYQPRQYAYMVYGGGYRPCLKPRDYQYYYRGIPPVQPDPQRW